MPRKGQTPQPESQAENPAATYEPLKKAATEQDWRNVVGLLQIRVKELEERLARLEQRGQA